MKLAKNCLRNIFSEFQLKNFNFQHNRLDHFYRSQWQRGERSLVYLIFRWILAFIFIGIYLSAAVLQFSDGKFFIFLTNWGICLCMITTLLAAILVTCWHFNLGDTRLSLYEEYTDNKANSDVIPHIPFLVKFYWFLHLVTLILALVITTVYWLFLHGKMNKPTTYPALSFITHCLNSVLMLIDFLVLGFPIRLLHTFYALIWPATFFFFTLIYYFCDGTDDNGNYYVYPILDWTNPLRAIITFIGVFCLYWIFALILFVLHHLKVVLARAFSNVWKPQVQIVGLV